METKNIYQKLQEARKQLSEKDLKKSGENKFSHYKYFELADFMPSVIDIFNNIGLTGIIRFTSEVATLTLINSDKPDEVIEFTSPVAGVDLKGMHAIQNLGAVQTYMRRYLYMAAMDITEPDALDAGPKTDEKIPAEQKPQNKPGKIQMTDQLWLKFMDRLRNGEPITDKIRSTYDLTIDQSITLDEFSQNPVK